MKHILVTGGAGFVGTNLIKRLLEDGHSVVSIDNYSTGLRTNHIQGNVIYIEDDISSISFLENLEGHTYPANNIDAVFHLAAIARIQPSFKNPIDYFETNATGTLFIAKYCADRNIPLVYAGSSSHHSGKFKNPYTFSKDIGEEIIQLFQLHYGLNASITRFYNVYGPHHLKSGGYSTLIGTWESCIENNQPITIYGDGSKRRDFTHVSDIVDALILIMRNNRWGYTFELGRGCNFSVQEIAQFFDYPYINYAADKPGEAQVTLSDNSIAKDELGWNPTRNIEDYIKQYRNANKYNTAV